jgi:3-hydroxyisobutyrate dehydrogenase-like beta-hydroxyacid dehydrogenase
MSESIGFIGLGSMGFPIARNLLTSGYRVRVFNRTKAKAMPLVKAGATLVGGIVYKGYGQQVAQQIYEPAAFRLRLGWKDLRWLLETAQETGTPMPVGSLLRDRMLTAIAKERGDFDWSAIALAASEDAGLETDRKNREKDIIENN